MEIQLQVINPYVYRDTIHVTISPNGEIDRLVRVVSNPTPNSEGEDAIEQWDEDIEELNLLFRNSALSTQSMVMLVKEGVFDLNEIEDEQDRHEIQNLVLGVRGHGSGFRRVQRDT